MSETALDAMPLSPSGPRAHENEKEKAETRKPRILFIQTQAENAGAQEITRLLDEGLQGYDYDIQHLFFYRRTKAFDDKPNIRFCADKRPSSPLALFQFLVTLVRQIREIKPDLVLTFQHYGNLFGAPAARLAGVRHVIGNQVSAQAVMNDTIRRIDKVFGRLGMFDVITVNSADTENEYRGFPKAYTDRIIKVPHGFKDKSSSLSKQQARTRFGLPEKAILMGCVARLHEKKRLDVGIQLLKSERDWHLVLGGQGPEEPKLRKLAKELNVEERVHFTGELASEQVGDLLAALDVFLFPSEAETFGLAAVEAAQTGLPVVANGLPVLHEVLKTEKGPCALFAKSQEPESFIEPIRAILNGPELAKSLVESARGLKELYSMDAMVGRYDTMIRDLLAK